VSQTKSAKKIDPPACTLTSKCSLTYTHDKKSQKYDFVSEVEADFNVWCDPSVFEYTYKKREDDAVTWVDELLN